MLVTLSPADGSQTTSAVQLSTPGRYMIGSGSTANILISFDDDPYVSSQHAVLELAPPNCSIRTLGGPNPVIVNGHRVREKALEDGDVLQVGFTRMLIQISRPFCYWCGKCDDELVRSAITDGKFAEFADIAVYSHPACLPPGDEFKGRVIENHFLKAQSISGGLTIQKKLGSGGFGSVFLAYDRNTNRVWAVKQMIGIADKSYEKRFEREGRFLIEYTHSRIARCMGTGLDPHWGRYLICEFVPDGDLASFVWRNGPQTPSWTLAVMFQVLAALDFLHTRPNVIVHRDVKPGNILLRFEKRSTGSSIVLAKLADFGISRALAGPGSTRLTQTGNTPGTLFFLAPEVLLSGAAYGPAADVYSAGVTIYHVLTGKYPYEFPQDDNETAQLFHVYSQNPISVKERLPALSGPLARVIDIACGKDPDRRYPDARTFAEALRLATEDTRS